MKVNRKNTGFGIIDGTKGSMPIDESQIIAFAKKQQPTLEQRTESEWSEIAQSQYSAVIAYAEKLKGQHEQDSSDSQKFTDLFYLEYAQRSLGIQELKKINASAAHQLGIGALDDLEWSGYSPEEIVKMYNDGYYVPYDVLVWAQSHNETDLTSYIVLNDEGGVDTNAESGDDTDVNNLKQKASDYVMKSVREQKIIDDNSKKLQDERKEVARLSKKKKSFFKSNNNENSIDVIKAKAEELKRLDEKNKEGKLTSSEKSRYKKLRKELGEHSSEMEKMKFTEKKLNDFLDSLDSLEKQAKDDVKLATDTIEAGEELSKFAKGYNINEIVSPTPEKLIAQNKGIEDVLAGAQLSEIPEISSRVGQELKNTSDEVISDLSEDDNVNLANFAKDYTQKAESVNNILHTEEGDLATQAQYQSPDKTNTDSILGVTTVAGGAMSTLGMAFGFMITALTNPVVALAYTVATLQATGQLSENRKQLRADSSKLNKDVLSHMQETKKLEQAVNKGTETQESNNNQIDVFISYLAELEERQNSMIADKMAETQEQQQADKSQQEQNTQPVSEVDDGEIENVQNEASARIADVEILESENQKIANEIQMPLNRTKKLSVANSQFSKDLVANNVEFGKNTNQTMNLSSISTLSGPLAMGMGTYNINLATSYITMGLAMLSNPFTYAFGQFCCNLGAAWIGISASQMGIGAQELAAGINGIDETSDARAQMQVNKSASQNEKIASKFAEPVMQAAEKKLAELGVSSPSDLKSENSGEENKSETNEEKPVEKLGQTSVNALNVESDNSLPELDKLKGLNPDIAQKTTESIKNKEDKPNKELNKVAVNNQKMTSNNENTVQLEEDNKDSNTILNKKDNLVRTARKMSSDSVRTENESLVNGNIDKTESIAEDLETLGINDNDSKVKSSIAAAKTEVSSLFSKQAQEADKFEQVSETEDEDNISKVKEEEENNAPQEEIRSNDELRAAAASTHISLSDKVESDDAFDRKLTRFNNDSIIESRRKAKRVTGVFSTSKKRA